MHLLPKDTKPILQYATMLENHYKKNTNKVIIQKYYFDVLDDNYLLK
jgi:hypothetical protein